MNQAKALLVGAALVALLMLTLNAASRAQGAPPTPKEQALSSKLSQEINGGLQCTENLIAMQTQMQSMQIDAAKDKAEIKRLTDKYEPKPEVKPEPKK